MEASMDELVDVISAHGAMDRDAARRELGRTLAAIAAALPEGERAALREALPPPL
jgi:hypothetical protein